MNINIRNINDTDHYEIELVAKRAFWNLNMPGCDEHYLLHRLWNEPCYIPEISLAATTDEKVVGAILYSKAKIETDHGSKDILTFGPLCVDPDHQRMGIGKKLLLLCRQVLWQRDLWKNSVKSIIMIKIIRNNKREALTLRALLYRFISNKELIFLI